MAKENPNTQPIESLSDSNINSKVDSVNDKDGTKVLAVNTVGLLELQISA